MLFKDSIPLLKITNIFFLWRSHTVLVPVSVRESGPESSRLNTQEKVLLTCPGTAAIVLQARWLIWFQYLVLTLAWHSALCHPVLSEREDVLHVTFDRVKLFLKVTHDAQTQSIKLLQPQEELLITSRVSNSGFDLKPSNALLTE